MEMNVARICYGGGKARYIIHLAVLYLPEVDLDSHTFSLSPTEKGMLPSWIPANCNLLQLPPILFLNCQLTIRNIPFGQQTGGLSWLIIQNDSFENVTTNSAWTIA